MRNQAINWRNELNDKEVNNQNKLKRQEKDWQLNETNTRQEGHKSTLKSSRTILVKTCAQ